MGAGTPRRAPEDGRHLDDKYYPHVPAPIAPEADTTGTLPGLVYELRAS